MADGENSAANFRIAQPGAGINFKVFAVLLLMAAVAAWASVPFDVHVLKHLKAKTPVPVDVTIHSPSGAGSTHERAKSSASDEEIFEGVVSTIFLQLVVTAVLIAVGLAAGTPIGLGAPTVRALLRSESSIQRSLFVSTGCGLGLGILSVLLGFAFKSILPPASVEFPPPPLSAGILASVGAAITEELWFRLALLSGVAWLGWRLMKPTDGRALIWSANGLAAIIFTAAHLPGNSAIAPMTAPVIVLGMLARIPAGIAFGWLYWRHGLLAAMFGHLVTDVVIMLAFLA